MRTVLTLVKVAVALAVLNGAARTGMATWKNMELKETAQRSVLFSRERPAREHTALVLSKAEELELPVGEDQVNVTQENAKTTIAVAYENPIEVFPRYTYTMKFSFEVEGFNVMR